MSDGFLGEIRLFGFPFAPANWAKCDGQVLSISQNQALYNLLGSRFGGNGSTTFALPDLRGRTPLHAGGVPGAVGGAETVTLTAAQVPQHTHTLQGTSTLATTNVPADNLLAAVPAGSESYAPATGTLTQLNVSSVAAQGGSAGHPNLQPSLVINACIALTGIYPTRP